MAKSTKPTFFTWRSSFQKSDLPSNTKLVLFCISTYMNDHGGGCFPSIKTLMEDCSLSNRVVILHIQKAQEAGFITVGTHGYSGQGWRRNEYHISYPNDMKVVTMPTEGGDDNDMKVVTQGHTNTPSNTPKNKKYKKDFEEFWLAYGKGHQIGNKHTASAKYILARKAVDQETLLDANRLYNKHLSEETWKQKKNLSSWLNQKAWLDEYNVTTRNIRHGII